MGRWRASYLGLISIDILTSSVAQEADRPSRVLLRHNSDAKDVRQSGRALQGVLATDPSCNVDNAKYTASAGQFQANAGFPPQTFAGIYGFGECALSCKNDSPCHSFSWDSATGACLFFQQSDNPTLTTSAQGWKSGAVSCSAPVAASQAVAAATSAPSVAVVPTNVVSSPAQPQAQSSVPSAQGSSPAPTPPPSAVASSSDATDDPDVAAKSTSESPPAETQQGNALALLAYPYWLWLIWAVMAAIIVGVCVYTMRQVDREGKKRKPRRQAHEDEESESTQDAQISPTDGYELLNPGKQEPPIQLATTLPSGVPLPPATLIQPQAAFIPGTHK